MKATVILPESEHYRRDAFRRGLERHGYEVDCRWSNAPGDCDVLVIWNRYPRNEAAAGQCEARGGTVLVTENAWLGPEDKASHHFVLCRGHHNGAGTWEVGPYKRFPRLNIDVKPWRKSGSEVVLLPQRGMGEPGVAMPEGWEQRALNRLMGATKRSVRIKRHPGKRPHPPMELEGAHCAVTWASGAAIKAIVDGIPVFYEFRKWIGGMAARYGVQDIENPFLGDREPMLERLAWAQWTSAEIASGEPFEWLL